MQHVSSFDVKTAKDFFREIVIPQYNDFLANNASSRHALLTTIVCYHFYEWVHQKKFTVDHFESVYPDQAEMANNLELARNITNGTKHFKNKNVTTRTQVGFSSSFVDSSVSFERPLIIKAQDDNEKSADILLRELVEFWMGRESAGEF